MTGLPAAGYISNSSRTQGEIKTAHENHIAVTSQLMGGGAETAYVTLVSDAFTPVSTDGAFCRIEGQGATSDNLKNMVPTNVRDGHVKYIASYVTGHNITVKESAGGSGEIKTMDGADFILSDTRQWSMLKYQTSGDCWREIARSQNIDALPVAGVTANYLLAGPTTGAAAKPTYRAMVKADFGTLLDQQPGQQARATATIATNKFTVTKGVNVIDTSGGAQTVYEITPGANVTDGAVIWLGINTDGTAATISNNHGGATNPIVMYNGADATLSHNYHWLILQLVSGTWKEIGRTGFSAAGAVQGIVQGRLSLTSGTAVTTSDVTGASTLYFTPSGGNQAATYSGSAWTLSVFTEKSLSLTALKKWLNYDIYMVDGTQALEALAWKQVTSSSTVTAGSSKTMNVSDTTGVAVGDWITVADSTWATVELARVASFSSNTSVTVDSLANGYTNPVLSYNARATALTLQDGVYVKSGATTRLYLGTIRMTAGNGTSGGTTEDSVARLFVWNNYNRVRRYGLGKDASASWTYSSTTARTANANTTPGTGRVEFIIGVAGDSIRSQYECQCNNTSAYGEVGIGFDSITTSSAQRHQINTGVLSDARATHYAYPAAGFHFVQALEACGAAATVTFYGTTTFPGTSTPFGGSAGLSLEMAA